MVNNRVNENSLGNAGNTNIEAKNLIVRDGGVVVNSVFVSGSGTVGDLNIRTSESVELSGEAEDSPGGLLAQIERGAEGFGGNLTIETKSLSVSNGSKVQVATFGNGDAGKLIINASEINIFETPDADNFFSTGIFAGILQDFRSETLPTGSGGQITIDTERLNVQGGARISASTFGEGNGGNVFIRARDIVEVSGMNRFGNNSFIRSEVSPPGSTTPVAPEVIAGKGGDINIETKQLIVRDGGRVSASTFGLGDAGNLTIKAFDSILLSGEGSGLLAEADPDAQGQGGGIRVQTRSFSLDDNAQLSAATPLGLGGNINLSVDDILTLRNNSLISAQAFNNADGGNVNIDANFIIAFPNQIDGNGSDIIASAVQGEGGEIQINAQSLFGIEEREAIDNNQTNDIDASSEFSLDGTVSINTPDLNPIQGVTELPSNIVEPEQTVAQACTTGRDSGVANSFVVKGKGGVPDLPTASLNSELITINGKSQANSNNSGYAIPTSQGDITPARGIIKTEDGQVILTAMPIAGNTSRTPNDSINCGDV